MADRLREITDATSRLGLATLRPDQRRAVDALAAGRDTLVVMPTGAGKSAVYLVAGAVLGNPTVVVSPLRALQRDQLGAAGRLGDARLLNSDMGARHRAKTIDDFAAGRVAYLLAGPEQLQHADLLSALAERPPALVAVDEAHCLSSWGPDFRPDYLRLGGVIGLLDHPTVVALTATAAPPVRSDIARRLGLDRPVEIVSGFDRPEIHLSVRHHHDPEARDEALVEEAAALEGSGLVYTATRRRTGELAAALARSGVGAAPYHAGMRAAEKRAVEEEWKAGRTRVVVSTTAFGMGIDKPDVRFVLHAEMAESLDAYAQEIGRAGRDGAPARAALFHRNEDAGLRRFFASRRPPRKAAVEAVLGRLAGAGGAAGVEVLAEAAGSGRQLAAVLAAAEAAGALEVLPGGAIVAPPGGPGPAAVTSLGRHQAEVWQRFERSRLEMIERYAAAATCRRRVLLSNFGEEPAEPCGNCDLCDAGAGEKPAPLRREGAGTAPRLPRPGSRVRHPAFGAGEVLAADAGHLTVVFDEAGYRTLDPGLVAAAELLHPEWGAGGRP